MNLLIKALKLITLFQQGGEVTVYDIMRELEITNRNAYYWLDAISLVLPIYNPNELTKDYHECLTYKMVK